MRFGEWIAEPVTPLFESWLLARMEEAFHAKLKAEIGQRAPLPHHVVVNGWYFYSLNWFSPSSLLRSLPSMLAHLIREPRTMAGIFPPAVRYAVPPLEREWRDVVQPRYRAEVAEADARVETMPVAELPGLIDRLADLAGEYFLWIAALGGAAYKMEINLARSYRRHLATALGGSHLPLLAGIDTPADPGLHAVVSLDWWHAPAPVAGASVPPSDHDRLVASRHAAEEAAFAVLAPSPKRLRAFRELLAETQRLVPIREEQTREWTLPWPIMRRAVVRMGDALAARGILREADDAFFLTRDELLAVLTGESIGPAADVAGRRATRAEQARLVPPNFVGQVNRAFRAMPGAFARMVGARPSDRAIVSGAPASPGTASGLVRIVRGPEEFDSLQPGEILVAPLTAPAWTPLFNRAAAVVTDVGSAAAHASIIAREYGIPAVVGCGDATARLRNGMRVTVDGATGNVEPA
jgi:pyruvate,water dikinase